jgi:hypothetical protein
MTTRGHSGSGQQVRQVIRPPRSARDPWQDDNEKRNKRPTNGHGELVRLDPLGQRILEPMPYHRYLSR